MGNKAEHIGNILARNWDKSQVINPYAIDNPQTLELKPKTDTISVKCEFEKYDNPVVEIVEGEIVVKLGKVEIGGVK